MRRTVHPQLDRRGPAALGPDLDLTSLARGLPLGDRVGGYTLVRWIGSGGMGAVFEASPPVPPGRPTPPATPGARVAVKLVPPSEVCADTAGRLMREAAILSRLSHPGIVRCLDSGIERRAESPGVPFLVMELVPGAMDVVSFCDLYNLARPDVISLIAATCDAIDHAHVSGIVHRDLKPSNILVDHLGKPWIIDFGVARSLPGDSVGERLNDQRTRFGQLVGTIAYMAPEQCEADPGRIDPRCDVYALGAILYRLLTGRPAYDLRKTPNLAAALRLRRRPPMRPSRVDRSIEGELENIMLRAIEPNPDRRYGSAAALASDLRRFRCRACAGARPPSGNWLSRMIRAWAGWERAGQAEPKTSEARGRAHPASA